MLKVMLKKHRAITRPMTCGLLCFVAMIYAASFPSGVYNQYVYQYKVDLDSGPQNLRFETKATLDILYTASESQEETFNVIDASDQNLSAEGVLVRLSLQEPKFLTTSHEPVVVIDPTNYNQIYNPDHNLYAHLLVLSNGTTLVKEIYTHQADTTTFKNIKKSILLNLLPTNHHHLHQQHNREQQQQRPDNAQDIKMPLFSHDNNHDQPELFSPDSISHVRIVATPLLGSDQNKKTSNNINDKKSNPSSKGAGLPTVYQTVEGEQNVTFRSRVFAQAQSNLTTKFRLELVNQLKSDAHEKFDKAESIGGALKMLDKLYQVDMQQLERERVICSTHKCGKSLLDLFKEYKNALIEESMATVEASVAYLRLLERLRDSQGTGAQDILNVLKKTSSRRGDDSSFLDILAAARTRDSIQAALKYLKLTKVIDRDLATPERFLSVLSVAAKTASKMHLKRPLKSPHYFTQTAALRLGLEAKKQAARMASFEFIAKELLNLFGQVTANKWASQKLRWSSMLTLATLLNAKNQENNYRDTNDQLNIEINELLLNELKSCGTSDTDCRIVSMQAIGNVGRLEMEQFEALKQQVLGYGRRESNAAMKILLDLLQNQAKDKPMDPIFQSSLREFLSKIVYDDNMETTSRVLAAEMIVRFVPNSINIDEMLRNLPSFKNNELATMIYSRIKSLRPETINKHHDWYWKSCIINGTSQSFIKTMARTDSLNASYGVNVELLNNGKILRESSFDLLLDTKERTQDLFSLGIFAHGFEHLANGELSRIVSAFLGGGPAESDEAESETAGMSLKLLGGYLRPYVFFNNLKELVNHYNKGTASNHPVTAFNGDLLLIDHDEGYPLISGFVAEQQMRGVLSIDVSGQITVSIWWHRESHSVVSTKASAIVQASQSVFTAFDKLWMSHLFSFGGQAKIDFNADVYFKEMPIQACIRVTQPEFKVRYHSRRHEQMMTNDIKRKVTRENFSIGAKSYSMNSENDQMCSLLLGEL